MHTFQDGQVNDDTESMSTSDDEEGAQDELERAKKFAALLKKDGSSSVPAAGAHQLSDSLAELNMDAYDDENDADEDMTRIMGAGNPGMAFYANPEDDPYLTTGLSDSEDELEYRETDLLIAAARNEDDVSHLEVWVYEEGDKENPDGNVYVHHSLLLPAFPLCLAWGPCNPRSGTVGGNYIAVGSFEPGIEIWDMDVVDAVEPLATLGGADYEAARELEAKKMKKKKKSKNLSLPEIPTKPGSHTDAVLGLAWNQEYCNVLASGSADRTVKVWDVATQQATHTLLHHSDKVQSVRWKPVDASLLLSGGFDKQLFLSDLRAPDGAASKWAIGSDVESLAWNPHDPNIFAVSSEDGLVIMFDTRKNSPIASFQAHKKAVTSVSFCPCMSGVLVTASTDGKAKLWKANDQGTSFNETACQKMGVGSIFSAEYCRDSPMLLAVGGAEGTCAVWDTKYAFDVS
jgi:periodic tryptophan protein 1